MYSEPADFAEKMAAWEAMIGRLNAGAIHFDVSNASILELGGAGGILGGLLSAHARRVTISDVIDTQTQYGGEFPKLLKIKFERNGYPLDLARIEFHLADAMNLPYRDNWFDAVISLNAFEHIPDPLAAIAEAHRVVKPGGVIYLSFDPIWTADSGNHFSWLGLAPWEHLLCDTEEFCERMRSCGGSPPQLDDFRHGLNRRPPSTYQLEMPAALRQLGVTRTRVFSWSGCEHEENINHPNRAIASQRLGIAPDDLLIRGFSFCIQK